MSRNRSSVELEPRAILSPRERGTQHSSIATAFRARDIVSRMPFATIDDLEAALRGASYLSDRGLSTALFPSLALEKPFLLEGEAGVGKTTGAQALPAGTPAGRDPRHSHEVPH